MKTIFTLLVLFFLQRSCPGQVADNTNRYNAQNIYFQAIKQYLEFLETDTFYSKYPHIDTLYVEDYCNCGITDSLINECGAAKIIIVKNPYELIKSRNGNGITLYRIFPLEYEKGEFNVSFVPFRVSIDKKDKKSLRYGNPGSYVVVFSYENERFIFVRIEDHGI